MSLRDHLQAIYEEYGRLTPALVLETARPADHPLHELVFDRSTEEAAEAFYLERAHELIQRVKIVYKQDTRGSRDVRAFHAVRTEDGYTYEPADRIAADPFLREVLLRDMEREWKQMRERYSHLKEFVELVQSTLPIAA